MKIEEISRNSCFKLSPTRVNFCAASSNTFPGHEEGAAQHLGRLPPLLSFFSVSFSTGQPRSFRSASSTACARKKKKLVKIGENWAKLGETGRNWMKLEEKLSKTDENWWKLVKTGENWGKLGKTGRNWAKLGETGWNWKTNSAKPFKTG